MREAAFLPPERRSAFLAACLSAFDPDGWDLVPTNRVGLLSGLPAATCAIVWQRILYACTSSSSQYELLELLEASGPVYEQIFDNTQRTDVAEKLNTVARFWP